MEMATKISILGSGAMATACSILLADHAGQTVSLWARNPDHAQDIARHRENRRLLPGVALSAELEITSDIEQAVDNADFLVAAIPTKFLRSALEQIAEFLNDDRPVISDGRNAMVGEGCVRWYRVDRDRSGPAVTGVG